ncbi:MAG: Gfo/Idh/MocA family oxidoreductase [Verrucomicrobiales bacterium]|mgnify:CR=1 FL=1|jgi:myo-inositol 2-dehydrogenase / D-chiro-inositol 1-dehydrogenase|nr:Gfo/Idh/MocA family oxidoreductase [Verrucomicrobiales bacterium]MDA7643914.1 Gfo/Idh/MocA family oxidoreductase [Verrucomicrobiales bacterium]MDF1785611.1 Gfo/Idh/MocA family oxidoreductase [Verrucomicrobiales bacterium]
MPDQPNSVSRRRFIQRTSATASAASLSALASSFGQIHTSNDDVLKIGLVGCGGRGSGACAQALIATDTPVKLVAMGDLFADQIEASHKMLSDGAGDRYDRRAFPSLSAKMDVPQERRFAGFDCFQKVIDSGIDMVILATPPGFRPQHFEAAVKANKHVFMEKPAAVDPPGIRRVMAAAEEAKKKNLSVVAGTQRRHQNHYREILKRVHDGAIGEIVSGQCYWNMGPLWVEDAKKYWETYQAGKWSDMEYQCRNWLFHVWLSGDHICEQHVHNIDIIHWAIGSAPKMVMGQGGRQERVQPQYGNGYDHFATEFEFENGVRVTSTCRQQSGASFNVAERLVGTKGQVYLDGSKGEITGPKAYEYDGERNDPYVQEHANLINSIRNGDAVNEGVQVAESTMSAIAGRMAAYTGRSMKWEWALKKSMLDLSPADYKFGKLPVDPPAVPGVTKLI